MGGGWEWAGEVLGADEQQPSLVLSTCACVRGWVNSREPTRRDTVWVGR